MSENSVRVVAVVSDDLLVGNIEHNAGRVLDTVLNPATEYLTLSGVNVFHKGNQNVAAVSIAETTIPKRLVSLIAIPGFGHEAPMKRHNALVEKTAFGTVAIVPGFTVQGRLYLQRIPHDSMSVLERDLATFFPMTNAAVSGGMDVKSATVFVNKALVSAFHVDRFPIAETDSTSKKTPVSNSAV